jgi:error-prone DNA polymerase
MTIEYAELHAISNFTFLRGASHPEELVSRAHELGYRAIALTDECSLSGIVRAHIEAREHAIDLIVGSELQLQEGMRLVLLATDRNSYGALCNLISHGRRQARKGEYRLEKEDMETLAPQGCQVIWAADRESTVDDGLWLSGLFPGATWIGVTLDYSGRNRTVLKWSEKLSVQCKLPRVACGNVQLHHPSRRPLRDTLVSIRCKTPLAKLGYSLHSNGEQYLRSRFDLEKLYPEELLSASIDIARRCHFSLDELRYEYPDVLVPQGYSGTSWLRYLTEQGVCSRWPDGAPEKVRTQLEMELKLISELRYEPYFLTVHDIVSYARRQGILCQGRGSAANSAVCYCLGITEVDPSRIDLLFERFISRERDEPPDIDVDFEHERREQVIQYIYEKYGRDRAAIAATVITYQPRSAIRDVGKAIGFSLDQVDRIAKSIQFWDDRDILDRRLVDSGFDPENPKITQLLLLVQQLLGFPRHLSQHVGGFVISRGPLCRMVPIENASMTDRTIIQWEKDDLESLGLLKIDVLALGMLSAIRKCFGYIQEYRGETLTMSTLPKEDSRVYNMIQQADTVGVFQIESRAQMSMLPRLKPACYYDLVIEIAIVRPGPIQGDMVHPYLRHRQNPETVSYPSEALRVVLERTLGVPIFQEQVMKIAMVAAGFSAGEADQLRRCMAAWKRKGGLEKFEGKLLQGMQERGYDRSFAEQVFNQIKGFGDYGFPESHSASFALLAYVSSWLKYYEPAAFCCALLNSQPMGFYRPAQLVNDAVRHGVDIRPVDINISGWDCNLESSGHKQPAIRLGLCMVKGLSRTVAEKIIEVRSEAQYTSIQEVAHRCAIDRKNLSSLAAANALISIGGHRHRAYWEAAGVETATAITGMPEFNEAEPLLRRPDDWDETVADYSSTGLTLGTHPLGMLRDQLSPRGVLPAADLGRMQNGSTTSVAGLVINRQRPMTASGVVFITLEDETGQANIVVWPKVVETQRRELMQSRLLTVTGKLQIESDVIHLIAYRLQDCSDLIGKLVTRSRDFH